MSIKPELSNKAEAELRELRAALDAATAARVVADGNLLEVQRQLNEKAAQASELAVQLVNRPHKQDVDALEATVSLLKEQLGEAADTSEVEQLRSELAALRSMQFVTNATGDDNATANIGYSKSKSSLAVEITNQASPSTDRAAEVARLQRRLDDALLAISIKGDDYEAVKGRCVQKDSEIKTLQEQVAITQREAKEATEDVAAKIAALGGRDEELEELRTLLNKVTSEKAEFRQVAIENEGLASEFQRKLAEQEQATNALARTVAGAQGRLKACEDFKNSQAAELEVEKKALRAAADALGNELVGCKASVATLQDQLATKNEENARLSTELSKVKDEAAVQVAAAEAAASSTDDTTRLLELDHILKNTDAAKSLAEKEVEKLNSTVKDLEAEKLELENEMGTLAKKYRKSSKEAKSMAELVEQTKQLFIGQKLELQGQLALMTAELTAVKEELEVTTADGKKTKLRTQSEVGTLKRSLEEERVAAANAASIGEETRSRLVAEVQQLTADLSRTQEKLVASENRAAGLDELESVKATCAAVEAEKQGLLERCMVGEKKYNALAAKFNATDQRMKDAQHGLQELAEENTELRKQINELTSREWQSNSDVKNCIACKAKFTATKRKHHCRNCGKIFCDSCSSRTAKLAGSKKEVRVCDECAGELIKAC